MFTSYVRTRINLCRVLPKPSRPLSPSRESHPSHPDRHGHWLGQGENPPLQDQNSTRLPHPPTNPPCLVALLPSEASRPNGTTTTSSSILLFPTTYPPPPDHRRSRDHPPAFPTTLPQTNKSDKPCRMIWPVDELFLLFERIQDLLFHDPKAESKVLPAAQSPSTVGRTMMQLPLPGKLHPKLISDLDIPG